MPFDAAPVSTQGTRHSRHVLEINSGIGVPFIRDALESTGTVRPAKLVSAVCRVSTPR
jgi:hypothetical protein